MNTALGTNSLYLPQLIRAMYPAVYKMLLLLMLVTCTEIQNTYNRAQDGMEEPILGLLKSVGIFTTDFYRDRIGHKKDKMMKYILVSQRTSHLISLSKDFSLQRQIAACSR